MEGPLHSSGPETLHLPRILCLHGAGVTAEVFKYQMRAIIPKLATVFRLVFVDGPFEGDMHPDLYPVYVDMGPYRHWSPWRPHQIGMPPEECIAVLEKRLMDTMQRDKGTGEWVGILGFSQGAKLAYSVLFENQLRRQQGVRDASGFFTGVDYKFGVILAGRAPAYALNSTTASDSRFLVTGQYPSAIHDPFGKDNGHRPLERLRAPTLHVHGLLDGGLKLHRELYHDCIAPESGHLVEWEGTHRLPFKTGDVKLVVDGIMLVAKQSDVL